MVWSVCVGMLLFGGSFVRAANERVSEVVIVCNEREPESRPLAEYYARQRGIPTNQICAIQIRPAETISRREFNEEIREPILRFLTSKGFLVQVPRVVGTRPGIETVASRVSFLALIYGVPLRIAPDPAATETSRTKDKRPELQRNEASVDSELALLPIHGLPIAGPLRNPFFRGTLEFGAPLNRQILLVARLDGPDARSVRRMIDDALLAERWGLHGRAYFDARGIQTKGYVEGDLWIKDACKVVRDAGYECVLDEQEALFDEDYPMSDVAIYAGWYAANVSGPFREPDFRFRPGAVAYHIHSTSASTIRTATVAWVGPFLARGAAATMGCVFEPYLGFTPHVDIFFQRWLQGWTFAEAACAATPSLSWQNVFVGDPLYRPFALSVDEQIERLQSENRPELEWAWLRKINSAERDKAVRLCRSKAAELHSAVLYEKLGDMVAGDAAIEAWHTALQHNTDVRRAQRIVAKLVSALLAAGRPTKALNLHESHPPDLTRPAAAVRFYTRARELALAANEIAKAQQYQIKLDELRNRHGSERP
ncbi:MAG: TIGR03790 family protein [Verrucomicrobiae bacterium]|nr:TIGR03790 family protein [Verrucomicrobiae bacterium]